MRNNPFARLFCNQVGSADIPPRGASHLDDWRDSQNYWHGYSRHSVSCSVEGCFNTDVCGAHVQRIKLEGAFGTVSDCGYIVPLCQQHNMCRGWMLAKEGVRFALIGPDGRVIIPAARSRRAQRFEPMLQGAFSNYQPDNTSKTFVTVPLGGAFAMFPQENTFAGAFGGVKVGVGY
jgi:hypothetical protein